MKYPMDQGEIVMSVYVDPLMPCIPSVKWPFRYCCHLIADTDLELQQFARRLGMRREWYEWKSALPHYILSPFKRKRAVELGAVELSMNEMSKRVLVARDTRTGT